jgi:spore coat polysaccharide biosynthesis predicted glycosyltransferase SpsG
MIVLCIESSHQRGMGHLYRALHLLKHIESDNQPALVLINEHTPSIGVLEQNGVPFETVDLEDRKSDWESRIIRLHRVEAWLNDRLDTDILHSMNVKKNGTPLITFDDRGSGAEICDLHFAALAFERPELLQGAEVFTGIEYLVLDPEIADCRRLRQGLARILVSMGGSDTYGTTLSILRFLKQLRRGATIHIGPSFIHRDQLDSEINGHFEIIRSVPSLIREFPAFDLAVTGGGITPFEANASGLPCIVVANEDHEKEIGRFLHSRGSSHYLGFKDGISAEGLENAFRKIDIGGMSSTGMAVFGLKGAENIWRTIRERIYG